MRRGGLRFGAIKSANGTLKQAEKGLVLFLSEFFLMMMAGETACKGNGIVEFSSLNSCRSITKGANPNGKGGTTAKV